MSLLKNADSGAQMENARTLAAATISDALIGISAATLMILAAIWIFSISIISVLRNLVIILVLAAKN